MIVLFTDFGLHGPYVGQMRAVLHQMAPGIPVIDLFADAPVGNCRASAYLLAAYAAGFRRAPSFSAWSIPASAARTRAAIQRRFRSRESNRIKDSREAQGRTQT